MRSSRPFGTASPARHHRIVIVLSIGSSRQMSATVTMWSSPVCADQHDVGAGRSVERGEHAAGPGRQDVVHPLGPLGHRRRDRAAQAGDRPGRGGPS